MAVVTTVGLIEYSRV